MSCFESLTNVKKEPATFTIALPTGTTVLITHIGDAVLVNGLKLTKVLYVPKFNHNLLSIHKLAEEIKCNLIFRPGKCVIIDTATKQVIGKGKMRQKFYYLKDDGVSVTSKLMNSQRSITTSEVKKGVVEN